MSFEKESEPPSESSDCVPRPGLEPGWVAPLVFETSASTDSAIWASERVQRYVKILNWGQKNHIFFVFECFLW